MHTNPPIIGLSFHKTALVCTWLEKNKAHGPLVCKAYETIPFNRLEYYEGVMFNMTSIVQAINTFIYTYKLKHAYSLISSCHPDLSEKILALNGQLPSAHHVQDTAHSIVWDYQKLNPETHASKQYYYVCALAHHLQFQKQILALQTRLNCIGIIPTRIALLEGCYYINSAAKTAAIYNHGSLQTVISYTMQNCTISDHITSTPLHATVENIIEAIGLFLVGVHIYEQS